MVNCHLDPYSNPSYGKKNDGGGVVIRHLRREQIHLGLVILNR